MNDKQPPRFLLAFGTRPEIIKIAPVAKALEQAGAVLRVVNTGQHFDDYMNDAFSRELGLKVDVSFGHAPAGWSTQGWILTKATEQIEAFGPDAVIVLGDTMTVPLLAMAARNAFVPVVHLEAGLRSFNGRSVEEVNRKMAAQSASINFAPTELAAKFLYAEGIEPKRVFVVGNTVTDTLKAYGPEQVEVDHRHEILLTAHRASNVDSKDRLSRIVKLARSLAELDKVVFPLHPRTRLRLEEFALMKILDVPGLTICPPLDYASMLATLSSALLVVTDSGGVQEECSWYGVPSIVLRRSTPRWEGVRFGGTYLSGVDTDAESEQIVELASKLLGKGEQHRVAELGCLYGDGQASTRIAQVLCGEEGAELLRLEEPSVDIETLPW